MEQITRESILQALKKIDENPELLIGRDSIKYDLKYQGEEYPPILVLSEAHKIQGGGELTIRDFNNSTQKAFKILRDHGFEVMQKEKHDMNVWFVCQGGTFTEERGKKFFIYRFRNQSFSQYKLYHRLGILSW